MPSALAFLALCAVLIVVVLVANRNDRTGGNVKPWRWR